MLKKICKGNAHGSPDNDSSFAACSLLASQAWAVTIPTSRTTNVVTKTNWEHVGVKPDIAVPAAQALQTAHAAILRKLLSSTNDDDERTKLQRLMALAEKGETEKPVYTLRGEL